MHRSKLERLTDIVLGEAVVALLDNQDRISARAVIGRLRAMEATEIDPDRLMAIKLALAEFRTAFTGHREGMANNVIPLDAASDGQGKKH